MADPDLQIRGGGGHPHPEIRGGRSQKKIFALSGWLRCWPLFKSLFMFLVRVNKKKGTKKPKRRSRLLHNKPAHSFLFIFLLLLGWLIQSQKTFLAKWWLYFTFLSSWLLELQKPGPGCSNVGWRQRISVRETNYAIRWIVIYPVGSSIQHLNNRSQKER